MNHPSRKNLTTGTRNDDVIAECRFEVLYSLVRVEHRSIIVSTNFLTKLRKNWYSWEIWLRILAPPRYKDSTVHVQIQPN